MFEIRNKATQHLIIHLSIP